MPLVEDLLRVVKEDRCVQRLTPRIFELWQGAGRDAGDVTAVPGLHPGEPLIVAGRLLVHELVDDDRPRRVRELGGEITLRSSRLFRTASVW